MDNFEKYIKENRQAFETHKVDKDKLWHGIALELDEESKVKTIPFWKSSTLRIAASVIFFMGLSVMAFLMLSAPSEKKHGGLCQ